MADTIARTHVEREIDILERNLEDIANDLRHLFHATADLERLAGTEIGNAPTEREAMTYRAIVRRAKNLRATVGAMRHPLQEN